ncbi:MAG: hypothetical protein V4729_07100 [Pseudomonadota bacterium]
MTAPAAPYVVILKSDIPDLERALLRRYCHELHGSDGSTVLQFLCRRLDTADARYLWMEAELPRQQGARQLRLPHDYVFLIDGDAATPARALPEPVPALDA